MENKMTCASCGKQKQYPIEFALSHYAVCWNCYAAEQNVHLTALQRGLAVSIFINVILLAVVAFTIGGK